MFMYMFGRKTRSNSFHGNEDWPMITVVLTPGYLQIVKHCGTLGSTNTEL